MYQNKGTSGVFSQEKDVGYLFDRKRYPTYLCGWYMKRPQRSFLTRFAPAPTGYLHLGHVVNAIYVWAEARKHAGRVLLRVEDHDRERCRPEYEEPLLEDLD